jgi:hypothetical protein
MVPGESLEEQFPARTLLKVQKQEKCWKFFLLFSGTKLEEWCAYSASEAFKSLQRARARLRPPKRLKK